MGSCFRAIACVWEKWELEYLVQIAGIEALERFRKKGLEWEI